jgi:peptide subunit release factor 1 (eRF1)
MQDVLALVSRLARVEAGPLVATLYLDTHWRDEQQRDRVRILFRDFARDARARFQPDDPRRAELEASLAPLEERLEELVHREIDEQAGGVVFVSSAARGLLEEIVLSDSIAPALYAEPRPVLAPLLEHLGRDTPAFLVHVRRPGAEIHELLLTGEERTERAIRGAVPSFHKMGGWRQLRLQHRMKGRVAAVWREVAEALEQLVLTTPRAWIVVFGTEENARGFLALLPPQVAERVVGLLPPPDDHRHLLLAARQALHEERAARDFVAMNRILDEALSDRNGTVGVDETVMAMNERLVKTLALTRRFDCVGYCCTNCDAVWIHGATGCSFCGGVTTPVGLREELVRRAVRDDVALVVIPDGNRLDAFHGLASLLRHRAGLPSHRSVPYGHPPTPTLAP